MVVRLIALCCIYLSCCFSVLTQAHPLAPSLLSFEETQNGLHFFWKTSKKRKGAPLSPRLPSHCVLPDIPEFSVQEKSVSTQGIIDCGSIGLIGQSVGIHNIGDNNINTVLLRYKRFDGSVVSHLLSSAHPSFVIPDKMTLWQVMREYVQLGIEHLVFGYDHVLFVLALLLLIRNLKILLWSVTFFTVGHSITLALSTLKVLILPIALIELAIAGSIVFLALEITRRKEALSAVEKHFWALPLAFGLLHGLGFASALAETGLPADEIPSALLAFNIGIELGQIAIIAAGLAVLKLLQLAWFTTGATRHQLTYRLASYFIGGISAYWVLERSVALIG